MWDDYNIDHIGRHGVDPDEAEEAFWDEDRLPFDAHSGHRGIIGATDAGRRLVVIFVKKDGARIRVITARNATEDEKRVYNKRRAR
ncbi:BrnT family toxin [uncultured Paenibacillus sp.]|uniref:BrnT family toxin n=1 Tax=uncultured Paenibacillus sp. TaxID=227322 RepID=UPI0037DD42A2